MILQLDMFRDGYVVVPRFKEGSYGMNVVDRGDMNDEEWRRWNQLSAVPEMKKLINDYRRGGEPISLLSKKITDYLYEKGIESCLTGSMRPMY